MSQYNIEKSNQSQTNDIAIIGFSGRFPGAKDVETFWKNISDKIASITFFNEEELIQLGIAPTLVAQQNYVRAKGHLEDAALFDAKFFGFTPEEAIYIDPQFRLFLELAYETLENAAYSTDNYKGKIGVFATSSSYDSYYEHNICPNISTSSLAQRLSLLTFNAKDFLAAWAAYKLNLNGPCMAVQTACSSSLVAICVACDSLLNRQCDIALAGGVSITSPLKSGYLYQPGMIFSEDGFCRPFDAKTTGCVPGNGGGILALKRLDKAIQDRDFIHAVIKGYNVGNDGNNKIGFTAPSIEGQSITLRAAMNMAQLKPEDISYIETHGTGTHLGDAVEFTALCDAFHSHGSKQQSIALGSVKPNIGHLDVAAGVAGTLKMISALKAQSIPPMLNYEKPNANIALANSPFFINTESLAWNSQGLRTGGVSSFGMGGTNAHVIMQEYKPRLPKQKHDQPVLLILSAINLSALIRLRRNLSRYLIEHPEIDLAEVAYTLQVGRKYFEKRFVCICSSITEAIDKLNQLNQLVFLENDEFITEVAYLKDKAQAWLRDDLVDWESCYAAESKPYRIPLPTYPFERREFWLSPKPQTKTIEADSVKKWTQETVTASVLAIFRSFLGMDKINSGDDFFDFGGDSLLSLQLLAEVEKRFNINFAPEVLQHHSSANVFAALLYEKIIIKQS